MMDGVVVFLVTSQLVLRYSTCVSIFAFSSHGGYCVLGCGSTPSRFAAVFSAKFSVSTPEWRWSPAMQTALTNACADFIASNVRPLKLPMSQTPATTPGPGTVQLEMTAWGASRATCRVTTIPTLQLYWFAADHGPFPVAGLHLFSP